MNNIYDFLLILSNRQYYSGNFCIIDKANIGLLKIATVKNGLCLVDSECYHVIKLKVNLARKHFGANFS